MTFESAFFDKELHPLAVERACLNALEIGDVALALRLIDRRCRIKPLADAHHFALRAELIVKNGLNRSLALTDIRRALAIDPDHIAANRRMLSWGPPNDKQAAARVLLKADHDSSSVKKAVDCLAGRPERAMSALREENSIISGFVLWRAPTSIELVVSARGDTLRKELAHDPTHPLADLGANVAEVIVRCPTDQGRMSVSLVADGKPVERFTVGQDYATPPELRRMGDRSSRISVIVPVYKDLEATRTCLESVLAQCERDDNLRLIVVEDATPEPALKAYLDALPGKPYFQLISNAQNLGFVGSVNSALAETKEGDVLLLNADAVMPPGSARRLSRVAHSAADIGTVTPLSNNGEYTSFPLPNEPNDLPSPADLLALDRAAERVNEGEVIDIPNGIGFCLYVKSACLAAIGPLSEAYGRGYLEDEDWCLTARQKGFRSVCAASVFVGHAGSKSFGADKRRLVLKNQKVLKVRHPDAGSAVATFLKDDGLRPARRALELAMPELSDATHLLVVGQDALRPVARGRAHDLRTENQTALLLECASEQPTKVQLRHPFGGVPQSVDFDLTKSDHLGQLEDYLARLKLSRIEIMDPRVVTSQLFRAIANRSCPVDIHIADAGLIAPIGAELDFDGRFWRVIEGSGSHDAAEVERWQSLWRAYGQAADQIIAPCSEAENFATRILPGKTITAVRQGSQPVRIPEQLADLQGAAVALVALAPEALPDDHVARMAKTVSERWPIKTLLAVGQFANELALMGQENLIAVQADETDIGDLLAIHRIDCMIFCDRQPIFGHPFEEAGVEHGLAVMTDLALPPIGRFRTLAKPLPMVA